MGHFVELGMHLIAEPQPLNGLLQKSMIIYKAKSDICRNDERTFANVDCFRNCGKSFHLWYDAYNDNGLENFSKLFTNHVDIIDFNLLTKMASKFYEGEHEQDDAQICLLSNRGFVRESERLLDIWKPWALEANRFELFQNFKFH